MTRAGVIIFLGFHALFCCRIENVDPSSMADVVVVHKSDVKDRCIVLAFDRCFVLAFDQCNNNDMIIRPFCL